MPITLPNLDDRRYADLVEEALELIPVHAPQWTNYNPSDPGITLVELFAYLTEMLSFRLNRVTVENVVAFLNLIDADKRVGDDYRDRDKLTQEVRKVVKVSREPYRAVTFDDYNTLVLKYFNNDVARVFTTTSKDKRRDNDLVDFIKVVVVPVVRSTVVIRKGAEYAEQSSDLIKSGNVPFRLVSQQDEYLYIGMESKFDAIKFNLNATVPDYTLRFEYFKGDDRNAPNTPDKGAWRNLPATKNKLLDLTSSWVSSGFVVFVPPADWRQSTVNAKTLYWVRVSRKDPPQENARVKQPEASAFQVAVQSVPVLQPDNSLLERISSDLDNRKVLTTRVRVAVASYRKVAVRKIKLHLKQGADEGNVGKAAIVELSRFFHPLIGWRNGKGWPFGRSVYLSEVIERLAGLDGVDFVAYEKDSLLPIDSNTRQTTQPASSIQIEPSELVDFRILESDIKTVAAGRQGLK